MLFLSIVFRQRTLPASLSATALFLLLLCPWSRSMGESTLLSWGPGQPLPRRRLRDYRLQPRLLRQREPLQVVEKMSC